MRRVSAFAPLLLLSSTDLLAQTSFQTAVQDASTTLPITLTRSLDAAHAALTFVPSRRTAEIPKYSTALLEVLPAQQASR